MTGQNAPKQTPGGIDVAKYAAQVIDGYESNKRYVGADAARQRTLSSAATVHAEQSGLTGRDAHRLESAAYQVGKSALSTYEARIEEGYPAGKARTDAVRVAAGYYDGQGEPKQPYGTLDVKAYAARTIDQYKARAEYDGPAAAKSSTVYAVSGTAEAGGVHGTRAARVASASIAEYERLSAKGAPHDLARDGAARKMAERYDQHAQDRQRQQGRDRGGMER